jgi:WD40 repeat protein
MDQTAIPAPLPVEAFFWTMDPKEAEIKDSFKVKCCDVHPELPYVLSADKSGKMQLWDIFRQKLLMNCSLGDMLQAVERRVSGVAHLSTRARRSSTVSHRASGGGSVADDAKRVKEAGSVVSVRFVDKFALCWTTGKPPADNYGNSYNNSSRIMVLCENCLLFYDYVSGIAHMLSSTELSKPPAAAEFIAPNLCAVGCSDGQIRVWDCLSWAAVKALPGHSKGPIVWLRMLCARSYAASAKSDAPAASVGGGSWGGSLDMSSILSSTGLPAKEEKPRLFSVGSDGGALLWDLAISGTSVGILGGAPAGHLLSAGCFAHLFDDSSDTLYTVAGDRTIRLWDVGNIGKGSGGVVRSAKRRSSFLGSSAGSEAGKIACVGKAKPRADLSHSIAKFTSCTSLEHPRFPTGTFAVAAKSDAIGFVQVYEAAAGDGEMMSEISSVTDSSNTAMRFNELHIFQMTSVLTALLVRLHEADPDLGISPALVAACRDAGSLRVYSVQAHQLYPHVLVAGTSLGVVALSMYAPGRSGGEGGGSRVGSHPAWGGNVLLHSEGSIRYSAMRVTRPLSAPHGGAGAGPALSSSPRPRSMQRRQNSRGSAGTSGDFSSPAPEEGVVVDTVADFFPSAAPLVPGGGQPVGLDTSTRSRTNSTIAQSVRQYHLAVLSCRPLFFPSCSGLLCAAYWAESHVYIVFKVGPPGMAGVAARAGAGGTPNRNSFSRGGSSSTIPSNLGSGEKMIEIDRGMCYSIGWCASHVDDSSGSGSSGSSGDGAAQDVLCLITPAKRISAPKRRQSILDKLSSRKKDTGSVLPASLVVKQIFLADLRVVEVLPSGAPRDAAEVIGGGAYVCVTTPVSAHAAGDGKKAVSQIGIYL